MKNKEENMAKNENESQNIKKKCKDNILSLVRGAASFAAVEMARNKNQKEYEFNFIIEKTDSKHLPERLIQLVKEKWVLYSGSYTNSNEFYLLFKRRQSIKVSNTIQNKKEKKFPLKKLELSQLNMLLNNAVNNKDYKTAAELRDIITLEKLELSQLNMLLNNAVDNEDYEAATKIRNIINARVNKIDRNML
jgi:protein-arginine kinase activator protein McsA